MLDQSLIKYQYYKNEKKNPGSNKARNKRINSTGVSQYVRKKKFCKKNSREKKINLMQENCEIKKNMWKWVTILMAAMSKVVTSNT